MNTNTNFTYLSLIFIILSIILSLLSMFSNDDNKPKHIRRRKYFSILKYVSLFLSFIFAFLSANNSLYISLYNSIGSFLKSSVSYSSSRLVEIIMILAPFVTVVTLFSSVRNFLKTIVYHILEKVSSKKVYIIYGDGRESKIAYKNIRKTNNAIRVSSQDNEDYYYSFNNHVLLKNEYDDNIDLALKIIENNKNAKISIFTNNTKNQIFKNDNVQAIETNKLVARLFWINNKEEIYASIKKKDFRNYNITIVGSNEVAYQIIYYGLQYNSFRTNQNINYKILANAQSKNTFTLFDKMITNKLNNDTICCLKQDEKGLEIIHDSDIVIIVDDNIYSENVININSKAMMYIYSTNNSNKIQNHAINDSKEKYFGDYNDIFNLEYIFNEKRLLLAKKVNYGYSNPNKDIDLEEMEELWNNTSEYNKNSSIAVADYYEMRKLIIEDIKDDDYLNELEHIRWSRYMFLNGWRYSSKLKTGEKDKEKKLHKDLVEFDKLTKEEKDKDGFIYKYINNKC